MVVKRSNIVELDGTCSYVKLCDLYIVILITMYKERICGFISGWDRAPLIVSLSTIQRWVATHHRKYQTLWL